MKRVFILLLLMFCWSISSFSQNGQYDVRLNLKNYDCTSQELQIDIDVRASSVENRFRIAEQNYRFTFNDNAIDSIWIVAEGTLSGFISDTGGAADFSLYSTHNLTGSLAGKISYNIVLSGGDGLLIETEWVHVGTMGFHVANPNALLDFGWNMQADFPSTFISEVTPSASVLLTEGMYIVDPDLENFNQMVEDTCGDSPDFGAGQYDLRLNLNGYDCESQNLLVDLDVRASFDSTTFRIAEQNYRFTFNENNIDSIWIAEEGTLSGLIPDTDILYAPHNLNGSLGDAVSYNVELLSSNGVLIETEWVNVGTLGFHVLDIDALLNFDWNAFADFPPTVLVETTENMSASVSEGMYIIDPDLENFNQMVEDICPGSLGSEENGQYDVRFNLNGYDCESQNLLVDIDVRASFDSTTFRIAEQNYRFTFNENNIDSIWIAEEGTLSGLIPDTDILYAPHNLNGSLGGAVSYNVELLSSDGVLIETEWVNVGTMGFHISDIDSLLAFDWSTQAEFPPTLITESNLGISTLVSEGIYIVDADLENFNQTVEDICPGSLSSEGDGQYDLRLNLNGYDCESQNLLVDIDVRASFDSTTFRIAEQNYRFTFNENNIDSIWIVEEGTLSGLIPNTSGASDFSLYSPHNLTGSLDGKISYNMELAGGDGLLIETEWVHVGTMGFHVANPNVLLDFGWNMQADFPSTFISEVIPSASVLVAEGMYIVDADLENFNQTVEDICPGSLSSEGDGQYDLRLNLNDYDCESQNLLVDIDVRASFDSTTFRIAEQNYRFTFNENNIDSIWIAEEGTLSGLIPNTSGASDFSLYSPHNLTGSLDGKISYNMELAGGDGLLIETEWVHVGTMGFHVANPNALLDFGWNMQADFPSTFISEVTPSASILLTEGMYIVDADLENFNQTVEDICFDNLCSTPQISKDLCYINDEDFFIDGVGFESNPSITFTDNTSDANTIFSDITLELFFRLKGSSCENEIAIQLTDPAGNTQALTAFNTCEGGNALYFVNLDITNVQASSGINNWHIEFDDTNDQNAGEDYSVRFARLKYTSTRASNGEPISNQVVEISDTDLFVDGLGFENNPVYTFTDPGTPADAVLSNISLELFFRLKESSCENEIAMQLTDPAGNTQALTAFSTCEGGNALYFVNLDIPSGNTTGSIADWVLQFDDTNDQNAGDEYSVRFARLTYTTVYTPPSGGGTLATVNETISEISDNDLFIDGTGFSSNDSYTFTDPGTPADAVLSNISLELFFRLKGSSCENEVALQLTDPAGNTQALTAFSTCEGGNALYFVNLDIPSGNTTGSIADWVLQFDDNKDQNADEEYSVRFGRLTYDVEYTECVFMLANEENNDSSRHTNTPTHQHINTSADQHINTLKLYPVPANQHLTIEYFSANNKQMNIQIISNEAKELRSKEVSIEEGLNTIQLNIDELPAGYYHIRMYGTDDVQMQSFIKISP